MKKVVLLFLSLYKKVISPALYQIFGHGCRFSPNCSEYGRQAVERFGIIGGLVLSFKRVLRCHPLSRMSHYDPVPTTYFRRTF